MTRPSLKIFIPIFALISLTYNLRIHSQRNSTVTWDSIISSVTSPSGQNFYDNLNSPQTNFYYGTITKQAYEMAVKLYKLDGYQQCGYQTPYATKDMQSCMICPKEMPLFNLGTRQCEECRVNITAKCDTLFNITAPAQNTNTTVSSGSSSAGSSTSSTSGSSGSISGSGSFTNTSTSDSTVNPSGPSDSTVTTTTTNSDSDFPSTDSTSSGTSTNSSSASGTSSISTIIDSPNVVEWKPKPKVENKTNITTSTVPIVATPDILEPVPVSQSNNTLNQNYTIDYRVVSNDTNKTQTNQTSNNTLIAESKGQNVTFSTQQCPALTPLYNTATKTCENCKENQEYVPGQKKCLQILWGSNPKSKYVILSSSDQLLNANLNIQKSNPQRTVRVCPIDRPLVVNNSCIACEGVQIFNFTSQQCQAGCPDGFKFSQENSQCIEATFLTNSQASNLLSPLKDFEVFRTEQNKKVKSSAKFAECPLEKPYSIKGFCSGCSSGTPYFNIENESCQSCARGRDYNGYTRKCESSYNSGLEIKKIVPNIF